jgi:enhancer of mRNA-decapping protein 4
VDGKSTASDTAAAAALAHSVAAGTIAGSSPAGAMAVGQTLNGRAHSSYNIDNDRNPELHPQLEVSPITMYNTEYALTLGQQITVNANYICYSLKTGQIRILNIFTAVRALLRGHAERPDDLRFFSNEVDLLGSASKDGRVFIRRILETNPSKADSTINEQLMLSIQLANKEETDTPGSQDFGRMRFVWHPFDENIFAIAVKNVVLICNTEILANLAGGALLEVDLENLPPGVISLNGHTQTVNAIEFSPKAEVLASGGEDSIIKLWNTKTAECLAHIPAHSGQPIYSVMWAPDASQSFGALLLSGGFCNHEVKLWVPAADGRSAECTQTVTLASQQPDLQDAFFNHAIYSAKRSVLILANTKRNSVYVLKVEKGSSTSSSSRAPCFSSISEFTVTMPILSVTAYCESQAASSHAAGEVQDAPLQLFCVQTRAVQQYMINPLQCEANPSRPPASAAIAAIVATMGAADASPTVDTSGSGDQSWVVVCETNQPISLKILSPITVHTYLPTYLHTYLPMIVSYIHTYIRTQVSVRK